jgi:hypothetical protein
MVFLRAQRSAIDSKSEERRQNGHLVVPRMREDLPVIAGLDPAIHLLCKSLFEE